jgi:predicted flap endonuclease-1-like 5' DNA nuclease
MQTLVISLVMVAVAFPAGWLLCRAWMAARQPQSGDESISIDRHHKMLRTQRSRYRRRVLRIHEVVRKHEETRDQIRDKLMRLQHSMQAEGQATEQREAELERARQHAGTLKTALDTSKEKLAQSQSVIASLESKLLSSNKGEASSNNEADMLRIERDELSARVRRLKLPEKRVEDTPGDEDGSDELLAQLGEARETLGQRDHRIRELERQLEQRDLRLEEMETTVNSWKRRVAPLARQVQMQRELIRRARAAQSADDPALAEIDDHDSGDPDELQKIRGIGPALERRLIANGVRRFEQLAMFSDAELRELADKLAIAPALPLRDAWAEQAQRLHEEQIVTTA